MQSFMWKPGISVSTASLGNSGVIDTHNSFDQLEATDSGWEYQPYELAGVWSRRSLASSPVPAAAGQILAPKKAKKHTKTPHKIKIKSKLNQK